jgi:hypothetical protein
MERVVKELHQTTKREVLSIECVIFINHKRHDKPTIYASGKFTSSWYQDRDSLNVEKIVRVLHPFINAFVESREQGIVQPPLSHLRDFDFHLLLLVAKEI